jgi:NAD(P)H-hydrate epimerase
MIKEFFTDFGLPVPAVTKIQMMDIDKIAMNETGPNLFQMMENAGRNLAELTLEVLGEKADEQKVIVLAGTGGNGGGGICAARHLSNRGADVNLCISEPDKLKEVTAYQLHILKSTDVKIISFEELKEEKPYIIIDALFGYNYHGEIKGNDLELIKWANNQLGIKISLDVPSGIDATTGKTAKHFLKPDLTLTLALPKTGLLPELTGELFLCDIGIPQKVYSKTGINFASSVFYENNILPLYTRQEVLLN